MVWHSSQIEPDDDKTRTARSTIPAREVIGIRKTLEELGSARCPLCRMERVARQGRAGPYFFCRCVRKPTKRAS